MVKKITKPKEEEVIKIPPLLRKIAEIKINGTSPLMVNRFDEKSKREIEDSYRKVAKQNKIPKSPQQEFEDSLYRMPGKKNSFGIPASGLKNCAVSACRFIDGVSMTQAKGAFHVLEDAGGLCQIEGSAPIVDERTVRVGTFGNKKPATRRRAKFEKWSVTFKVQYRPDILPADQLLNLYENAGFSVGLCEFRPEKSGNLGMFEVARK